MVLKAHGFEMRNLRSVYWNKVLSPASKSKSHAFKMAGYIGVGETRVLEDVVILRVTCESVRALAVRLDYSSSIHPRYNHQCVAVIKDRR